MSLTEKPSDRIRENIDIVDAVPENVDEMWELLHQSWLKTFVSDEHHVTASDIDKKFANPKFKDEFRRDLTEAPNREKFLLAKERGSGKIIGMGQFTPASQDGFRNYDYISKFYFLPEYMESGRGVQLWRYIRDHLLDPEKETRLNICTYNENGLKFWKKCRFEETEKLTEDRTMAVDGSNAVRSLREMRRPSTVELMSVERQVKDFAAIGIDETLPGRNSIALGDGEDKTIRFAQETAERLFRREYNKESSEYAITTDAFGNLFIRVFGKDRSRTVMSGSHADSVRSGGMYDGPVGVATAMDFMRKLVESNQEPACNYTVAVFRSEESSPTTGFAGLGSAIATGQITEEKLNALQYNQPDGKSVPLRDYFSARYGVDRWAAVIEELTSPPINTQTVSHYEEVHIEQSAVAELNDVDVAIVAEGIGGSRREGVQVGASDIPSEEIVSTKENPYDRIAITITGRADHTGGAPHNETDVRFDAKKILYRQDALLGATHTIEMLTAPHYSGIAKISSVSIPTATGFTTVPAIQHVELAVPSSKRAEAERRLVEVQRQLQTQGLEVSFESQPVPEGTKSRIIDATFALSVAKIPKAVEDSAWQVVVVNQFDTALQRTLSTADPIGKVRATVTDFQMNPDRGLSFNIDQRNVNPQQAQKLSATIDSELDRYLGMAGISKAKVHRLISDVPHAPVDRESVEIKRAIANTFGLKTVVMPSMPGHDAGSVSKAGIPTSMTFVRHDGISHNPREHANAVALENAAKISHGLLAKLLEVNVQ